MSFMDFSTRIRAYFRQSEGQIWLLGIVILGIIIIISAGYLLYNTVGVVTFSGSQSQEISAQQSQPEVSSINQISQTPLFGPSHQATVSRVNTNLELLGIMLETDPKKSRAIIASLGRGPKIYRIDQELADGGKLYRVYENKVELKRNGQIESLFLKWDKRRSASEAQRPSISPSQQSPSFQQNTSDDDTDEPVGASAIDVGGEQPQQIQTPQEWQERIKEIREKYQQQFSNPNNGNPSGPPIFPTGPKGRIRGGM
ncbi:MAG: hypothetical protein K2X50_02225 [Gammaproteobacteria bacterium]|nr:hypothetical protein [Gammaproteobacteria bacterium]